MSDYHVDEVLFPQRDRIEVVYITDLSEHDIKVIRHSHMDSKYDYLNALMDE